MNFRAIAVVVFLVVVSGSLMVHFREQSITGAPNTPAKPDGIPLPPKTGPYGKFVVTGEPIHNFGVMELGQKGTHAFKIRNEGRGPLKMVARKEDHTCQCTLGSLGSEGLKPGEESTVTMEWEIKNPATYFEHSAKIRTDDPDNPVTTFRVRGFVGKRLTVRTGTNMMIGQLSDTTATERTFVMHSETVEAFDITKLETSLPMIVATSRPLLGDDLKMATRDPAQEASEQAYQDATKADSGKKKAAGEPGHEAHNHGPSASSADDLAGKHPAVRSGHEIKVVFNPGLPIGKFRESLTIHTNIPETPPLVIIFEGSRAGPIEILGTPGTGWVPQDGTLRFARFRATEGKKVKLIVFVKKFEMPLEILEAKVKPTFMKYQLVKDEKFKGMGRDRYDLFIEIPAGEAPISASGLDVGSIVLTTNHPDAKTINLGVEFNSY